MKERIRLLGNHGNHSPFGFGFGFGDTLSTKTKTKTKTKPKALWNRKCFGFGLILVLVLVLVSVTKNRPLAICVTGVRGQLSESPEVGKGEVMGGTYPPRWSGTFYLLGLGVQEK